MKNVCICTNNVRVSPKDNNNIKIVGTNGKNLNLIDFLPVIYSISICDAEKKKEKVQLYVGKSKLFDSRKSTHIVSVFDDPSYLKFTFMICEMKNWH